MWLSPARGELYYSSASQDYRFRSGNERSVRSDLLLHHSIDDSPDRESAFNGENCR